MSVSPMSPDRGGNRPLMSGVEAQTQAMRLRQPVLTVWLQQFLSGKERVVPTPIEGRPNCFNITFRIEDSEEQRQHVVKVTRSENNDATVLEIMASDDPNEQAVLRTATIYTEPRRCGDLAIQGTITQFGGEPRHIVSGLRNEFMCPLPRNTWIGQPAFGDGPTNVWRGRD